jgi:hypothetical protein
LSGGHFDIYKNKTTKKQRCMSITSPSNDLLATVTEAINLINTYEQQPSSYLNQQKRHKAASTLKLLYNILFKVDTSIKYKTVRTRLSKHIAYLDRSTHQHIGKPWLRSLVQTLQILHPVVKEISTEKYRLHALAYTKRMTDIEGCLDNLYIAPDQNNNSTTMV